MAKSSPEFVVKLAMALIKGSGIANRFIAYELVQHHKEALRSLTARDLVELGRGIDSWSVVDMFACYLVGPAWRENRCLMIWFLAGLVQRIAGGGVQRLLVPCH